MLYISDFSDYYTDKIVFIISQKLSPLVDFFRQEEIVLTTAT